MEEGRERSPNPKILARRLGSSSGRDAERARSAISAYIYGNVLVLTAVLDAGEHAVSNGRAALQVLIVTVTTYLAHVMAQDAAHWVGRSAEEHHIRVGYELRDAMPILASGIPPGLLLCLGWSGALSPLLAQNLAAAFVISRLAITGWTVQRLSGSPARRRSIWTGIALALAGLAIAGLKIVVGH
jgi:hypothetical protein